LFSSSPIPYQLLILTIQGIAIGTILAWIRLMSGSLWTVVIFHAVLNGFGQGLFEPLTSDTGITPYIAGEQGLALAISWSIVAFLFGDDGLISLKSKLRQYPRKTHY